MRQTQARKGFTVLEAICALAAIGLLAVVIFPHAARTHSRSGTVSCAANLKLLGETRRAHEAERERALLIRANRPKAGSSETAAAVEREFLRLAPKLADSRTLICPRDTRQPAARLAGIECRNISYFLNLAPAKAAASAPLAGDRDLRLDGLPAAKCVASINSATRLEWSGELHRTVKCGPAGNMCLGDGSVRLFSDRGLANLAHRLDEPTQWIAVP